MRATVDNLIMLFVKAPTPDKVKTRLAAHIGGQHALRLYENFVADILGTLKKTGYPIRICYSPPDAGTDIARWLGGQNLAFDAQNGGDLGERMKNAFIGAFRDGYKNVLLIGSDIPDLPPGLFRDAFEALIAHDAVVGPSKDGGYYLIGFRRDGFKDAAFDAIPWSTERVLARTLDILKHLEAQVNLLPSWRDIDDVNDLADFIQRHAVADSDCDAPRTRRLLMDLRLKKIPIGGIS